MQSQLADRRVDRRAPEPSSQGKPGQGQQGRSQRQLEQAKEGQEVIGPEGHQRVRVGEGSDGAERTDVDMVSKRPGLVKTVRSSWQMDTYDLTMSDELTVSTKYSSGMRSSCAT